MSPSEPKGQATEGAPEIVVDGKSHVGRVRERNEDRYVVVRPEDPTLGVVLCVADGMGGHPAGEDASTAVVEIVGRWEAEAKAVVDAGPEDLGEALTRRMADLLREAHEAILAIGERHPEKEGLGTTGLVGLVHDGILHVFHCGDSRAYILRGRTLEQITGDHVVLEGGMRFLAAHLGMPEGLYLDRATVRLKVGDRILLCTDGLTDMVPPEAFGFALLEAKTPAEANEALIALALEAGGLDNVTCVTAFYGPRPPEPPPDAVKTEEIEITRTPPSDPGVEGTEAEGAPQREDGEDGT